MRFSKGLSIGLAIVLMAGVAWGEYGGSGTFDKITSLDDLESGTYYVFYGINGSYTGAMTNTISRGRLGNTSVTPSGESILNPSTAIVWYVVGNSVDGYTVYNEAADKYAEIITNSTNGFALNTTSTHEYDVTVSSGAFTFASNHASGGGRAISIYQNDWRPYVSPNTLNLYKYSPPSSDPEPSNHVTSFSASADGHNAIDLTWSDNDGTNVASGFLILANTSGTFTDPVDGTAQADDTDLSDGSGVKNVGHGVESYTFSGLDAETTYYFKIYPYSNSGSNIDYKTDGTVPTDDATTDAVPPAPSAGDLYISEVCDDDQGGYQTAFMEIYNNSSNTLDMTDCYIERWQDGSYDSYSYTFNSDVTIPPYGVLVVSRGSDQSSFETAWSIDFNSLNATYDSGNNFLFFTTGRSYKLFNSSDIELDVTPGVDEDNRVYQITIGNWSSQEASSNGTPGELEEDQSLPVTLSSFTAKAVKGTVVLEWETSAEVENQGFVLSREERGASSETVIANFATDNALKGQGSTTETTQYRYVDTGVEPGKTYVYTLADVDYANKENILKTIEVTAKDENAIVADGYALDPVYPNPFNATLTIPFTLTERMNVSIDLYSITGQKMMTVVNREFGAGSFNYTVQTHDLASGIYFVRTLFNGWSHMQKAVLIK